MALILIAAVVVPLTTMATAPRAAAQSEGFEICEVGTLEDRGCVEVVGSSSPGPDVCPTSSEVAQSGDDCFRLVPGVGGSGCPAGTTLGPVGVACRAPVDRVEQMVEGNADCPEGFTESVTFKDVCVFVEAAQQADPACPLGSRGTVGDCYIAVTEQLECPEGTLAGDVCVVVGAAPRNEPSYCATEFPNVFEDADGCFTLEEPIDGVCRFGVPLSEDGLCRIEVDLRPGPQFCTEGFGLVSGRCLRYVEPVSGFGCPAESVLDSFGVCRQPVDQRRAELYCPSAAQQLDGAECVISVPLERECDYNEVIAGCNDTLVCPPSFASAPTYGGLCTRYEPTTQSDVVTCPDGARGVAGGCYILVAKGPAGESGIAACPSGSIEDRAGSCRRPVADARPIEFCPERTSSLNRQVCVFVTAPIDLADGCPAPFATDGDRCVWIEDAVLSDTACRDANLGTAGDCTMNVVPLPSIDAFCELGSFSGLVCDVIDEPLTTRNVCPESSTVLFEDDFCYTLVPKPDGADCPVGTVADPNGIDCRRPVDLRPVAETCAEGFSVIRSRCRRYEAPVADFVQCPPGSSSVAGGGCHRPTAQAQGAYYCEAPWATLQFQSCVYTAPLSDSCTTDAALAGACGQPVLLCPEGYSSDDSLGGQCTRFEPASQLPEECPAGTEGTVDNCYILVDRVPGNVAGTLVCPTDAPEDADGNCRQPVENTTGAYICSDPAASLNGKICVFTASFIIACDVIGTPCSGSVETELVCPVSASVFEDGDDCFSLVSFDDATCPMGTTADADSSLCREPIALVEGPGECADGLVREDDQCLRITAPLVAPSTDCSGESCPLEVSSEQVAVEGDDLLTRRATTLSVDACAGGDATYVVIGGSGEVQGSMTEGPDGVYVASFTVSDPATYSASARVDCPDGTVRAATATLVFIDPSGAIVDCARNPVPGAEVTLWRADDATGTPVMVADGDDSVMDPTINVANPSISDADGRYRWDVVPGFYQVTVRLPGQLTLSSAVLSVPPERTDVDFVFTDLNCPVRVVRSSPSLASPAITNPPTSGAPAAPAPVAVASDSSALAVTGSETRSGLTTAAALISAGFCFALGGSLWRRRVDQT